MSYFKDLAYLERGLAAGAVDPSEAISSILELDQARRVSRQERKQAQAGALDELVATAQTAAAEGTPMSQLKPLLDSLAQGSGLPSMPYGKLPGIDPLYEKGVSTVNPMVDTSDTADISNMVYEELGNAGDRRDLGIIRQRVQSRLAQSLRPEEHNMLTPAIDEIITQAYSQAVRTPTTNYMDQFLQPPA